MRWPSTPDPFTEAKGYNGPVLLLRADDDRLVDEGTCSRYAEGYTAPEVDTIAGGGHNFATLTARAAVEEKTAAFIKAHLVRRHLYGKHDPAAHCSGRTDL